MSKEIIADISINIRTQYSVANGSSRPKIDSTFARTLQWLTGKGKDQADQFLVNTYTLARVGGGVNATFFSITGSDKLGQSYNIRSFKLAVFAVRESSAKLGVRVAQAFGQTRFMFDDSTTGGFTIRPGGFVILAAPDVRSYDTSIAPTATMISLANLDTEVPAIVDVYLIGVNR